LGRLREGHDRKAPIKRAKRGECVFFVNIIIGNFKIDLKQIIHDRKKCAAFTVDSNVHKETFNFKCGSFNNLKKGAKKLKDYKKSADPELFLSFHCPPLLLTHGYTHTHTGTDLGSAGR